MNIRSWKSNESGFTLVELMVVVGIIGILSAVAIPRFQTYQAKSKTSEARIHLSAIYTTETALMSDYDSYGTCLAFAGYEGPGTNNYYAVGFSTGGNDGNEDVRLNGGTLCTNADTRSWAANKRVGGWFAPVTDITGAAANDDGTFIAVAIGAVNAANNTATTCSEWTINQDKAFVELQRGY